MDLTTRSQQAVSTAVKMAAERGNPAVEPAHLAVALLDDAEGLTRPLLEAVGIDPLAARATVQRQVRDRSDEYVSTEHLLIALADLFGAQPTALRDALASLRGSQRVTSPDPE